MLCGGRNGDGKVMSNCVAYTPRTKVTYRINESKYTEYSLKLSMLRSLHIQIRDGYVIKIMQLFF